MSLSEIQKAVDELPAEERQRLTTWLVSRYPALTVEQLMDRAKRLVDRREWEPTPPSDENRPTGRTLEHGLRAVEELGLGK